MSGLLTLLVGFLCFVVCLFYYMSHHLSIINNKLTINKIIEKRERERERKEKRNNKGKIKNDLNQINDYETILFYLQ